MNAGRRTPNTERRTSVSLRVADIIDHAPVGRLQVTLFTLSAACLILDGFDVQVVGYVAPRAFEEWHVNRAALGNVLAAGNFGVMVGSLVFTMVGDKVGRRPVLLARARLGGTLISRSLVPA